jgi:acetamidase/formamidase
MKAAIAALLESRSSWVGAVTAAVSGMIFVLGKKIGMTEADCYALAGIVVSIGLTMIGKMAVQNTAGIKADAERDVSEAFQRQRLYNPPVGTIPTEKKE